MKRELIDVLPHNQLEFRWVSDHWDVHLNGTCIYDGSLCEFKKFDDILFYKIYKLGLLSKLKWYWKQWLFELCVGYHWSYSDDKGRTSFLFRKPTWLYTMLLKLYYSKIWKKKST